MKSESVLYAEFVVYLHSPDSERVGLWLQSLEPAEAVLVGRWLQDKMDEISEMWKPIQVYMANLFEALAPMMEEFAEQVTAVWREFRRQGIVYRVYLEGAKRRHRPKRHNVTIA